MSKITDCLLIGYNEMQFSDYEGIIKSLGSSSASYRDLNMNFLQIDNKKLTVPEVFNYFSTQNGGCGFENTFPATISYLANYLDKKDISFDYILSFQNEKEQLIKKLQNHEILTVAVTTTFYTTAFPILEIIALIRKYNNTAKIIVGGPLIYNTLQLMEEQEKQNLLKTIGSDYYIYSSQGEFALTEIINAVKSSFSADGIKNIIYKDGKNYITTHVLAEDNKLDENIVDWSLFAGRVGKFAAVRTTISCPFSCSFCLFPKLAGKYQTACIEAVEKELNSIATLKTVKSIAFIDDTLNVPNERFKAMLRMMIKNKYGFNWNSNFRCQFTDRETVELMKESGCEGVFLGIESGSDKILKNMNKSATTQQYKDGIALLKEYGITTFASFIVGFSGETDETVLDTIKFIDETEPDFFHVKPWFCQTNTPIWQEKTKYKLEGFHYQWKHETMDIDSACDWVEGMFKSIRSSIWMPEYNFQFVGIFYLLHRGYDLCRIKEFLINFNKGISQKLDNPYDIEVDKEILKKFEKICSLEHLKKCKA